MQEEIIHSVLEGNDTLALMPTGGGKSLTFQVPSLGMDGICIVITPLIALMKDQVDQLTDRGIKAAAIHSGMTRNEISVTLDNCVFGGYKFLYVSPERLRTEVFRTRVRDMQVNLIAVDEAHCISQWGYDFRPSYLEIHALREVLEGVPVLALTATATPEVCEDIQVQLGFGQKNLLSMSFDRPNLAYVVRRTENKTRELARIISRIEGSGIVYARNRKKCRELSQMLGEEGITSGFYHAGLKQDERNRRQQEWTGNLFRVMVATNAFGMGIDKPDVRFVIHVDLPDTPEAYFQEAGRAGRDGKRSWAILLFSPSDRKLAEQRIEVNFPGIPKVRQVYMALCNFLQVPVGSGRGQSYDFGLGEFLRRYRLNSLIAHSSLNILAREGYIALTEAFNNPSRIMFLSGRDELYHFQVKNAEFDDFIKLLLRSYSGLFTAYARIDESYLARNTGLPQERVYSYLKALADRKIISYIPRKDTPVITFLEERLDEKNLLISPDRYQSRKERYEKRIREMIRYADSEETCRNRFLLSYFGQLKTPDCGRCDVCLSRRADGPGHREYLSIRKQILETLAGGSMELEDLLGRDLPDGEEESDRLIRVVEQMLEDGDLVRDKDLKIRPAGS
jgi:ATP-dependent DNA helicase RecQ